MKRSTTPIGAFAAVFIAAVLVQTVVTDFLVSSYDEGLTLYGSVRVLHGQIPYRDFWTMYSPGQFYVFAAVFRLFGVFGFWDRVIFVLTNALSAVAIVYLLQALTGRPWFSRFIAAAILLSTSCRASYGFPVYQALSFILIATACMMSYWQRQRRHVIIWAGAALGLAALFRHDLALYALVALGVAGLVHECNTKSGWRLWQDTAILASTSLIVVAPAVIVLVVCVPLHDLYYSLFYVPGVIYPKVRSLPFPSMGQVLHGFLHLRYVPDPGLGSTEYNIVWLPLLAVLASLPYVATKLRKCVERWKTASYVGLILLTGLLFVKGWVRVSPLHMVPAVVPAIMLCACLLCEFPKMRWRFRIPVACAAVWTALCLLAFAHRDYIVALGNLNRLRSHDPEYSFASACHPQPGLDRAKCLFIGQVESQTILFLQSETSPDDQILVGPEGYDKLFNNDIGFYFFSARDSASKWYDLHPGVETSTPIQREMIRELAANRVKYVLVQHISTPVEANGSSVSSGVRLLEDYLQHNYRLQRRFGINDVLERSTRFEVKIDQFEAIRYTQ